MRKTRRTDTGLTVAQLQRGWATAGLTSARRAFLMGKVGLLVLFAGN